MEIVCENCGASIPPNDVNISAAVAVCRNCNKTFTLNPSSTAPRDTPKSKIGDVAGIAVKNSGLGLVIERRWFMPTAFFLLFFCFAWDAFLVFWYGIALSKADTPWIMIVFPIAHVAVGVGLTYYTLALFMNTTKFILNGMDLRIKHGPIPWKGSGQVIPRAQMDQFYIEQNISYGRNGQSTTYNVLLRTKAGTTMNIATGLSNHDQARKIEQEIEKAFGIQDRAVAGEFR